MKTKYDRMSKVEKKELFKEYKINNTVLVKKMNRMFLLCYLGLFYGIISFCYDCFYKGSTVAYILDIIVFIFCVIVLLRMISIKKRLLNKYALEKDKLRKKDILKKYKK